MDAVAEAVSMLKYQFSSINALNHCCIDHSLNIEHCPLKIGVTRGRRS
jgi:hypothetical protein